MAFIMDMIARKKKKQGYHQVPCSKCKKPMVINASGICFNCRTSLCECGKRYTKQANLHKPESRCSACRKKKVKMIASGIAMINNAAF